MPCRNIGEIFNHEGPIRAANLKPTVPRPRGGSAELLALLGSQHTGLPESQPPTWPSSIQCAEGVWARCWLAGIELRVLWTRREIMPHLEGSCSSQVTPSEGYMIFLALVKVLNRLHLQTLRCQILADKGFRGTWRISRGRLPTSSLDPANHHHHLTTSESINTSRKPDLRLAAQDAHCKLNHTHTRHSCTSRHITRHPSAHSSGTRIARASNACNAVTTSARSVPASLRLSSSSGNACLA